MLWRGWSLLAGAPVGVLATWAWWSSPPGARALGLGALAGALALVVAASALARAASPLRAASAASAGFAALPAVAACILGLAPGPRWWLAGVLLALTAALARAARSRRPARGPGTPLAAALAAAGVSALAILAAAAAVAAAGGPRPELDEARAEAVLDIDAGVVTRPLPRCRSGAAEVRVLLARGARPRLGPRARWLWFDAADPDGRRQVHRLDRESGAVVCWTCGEPGNNLRPAPGDSGTSLVFETDRHASAWDPTNTEVHWIASRGDAPEHPSRRLTRSAGPDDHALLGPGSRVVVWSSAAGGRYAVVSASLRSAHGGLSLGSRGLMARGGAQWIAPLAWSPDARSLVLVRGNPLGPLAARALDLATGDDHPLGAGVASGGGAAFNADGGWVALATARRACAAGLLPAPLGFVLGRLAGALERRTPLLRHTGVRVGEPRAEGTALELGEIAAWGEPTGIALAPDGAELFLGQRRAVAGGVEERLLQLRLDCAPRPAAGLRLSSPR